MANAAATTPDVEQTGGLSSPNPNSTLERAGTLERANEALQRVGTQLQRAGTNMGLQRASTLPTADKDLRHAATMPITYDLESIRPFCGGMWKTQQLIGFILGVACFVGTTAFTPIAYNHASNRMLGITLLCGCFWVLEVLPIHITALIPLVLMPCLGITSSEIAATAYWNPIQMLIIGTFLVDIALEEVHLPRRLALKLLMTTGVMQPWLLLLMFMMACWVLAMFVNNVAVTLMITPFAIGLMSAAEERAADADAEEPLDTDRHDGSSRQIQRFSTGLLLGIAYSTTAGGMATLVGSIPNELLLGSGAVASQVHYGTWIVYAFPVSLMTFIFAYMLVYIRYVRGVSLKLVTHEVLEVEYEELTAEIGSFSRDELIVAIIQVTQFGLLFSGTWITKMPVFQTQFGEELLGDSTLACLPAIFLFLSPSKVRPGQSILTWPAVHEKFDFGLILLIGGGFAIASGFEQSGLNIALGNWIADIICELSTVSITLVIVLITTIATQVFSAVGTATTMIPTLVSAASRGMINPLSLVLPATVACSIAFALPTATPANVIVLAKSRDLIQPLRVRDFFLTGLPLNCLMVVFGGLVLALMGGLVFDADSPFPKWACDGVGCIWASVPGTVRGVEVLQQACIGNPATNMTTCVLANGTHMNVADVYNGL